jgi:hypothetical protein
MRLSACHDPNQGKLGSTGPRLSGQARTLVLRQFSQTVLNLVRMCQATALQEGPANRSQGLRARMSEDTTRCGSRPSVRSPV